MPPPPEQLTSSKNQDQIQNLLNLLNTSNQFNQLQANLPTTAQMPEPQIHQPQPTREEASTTPVNYEIATLLASLSNPDAKQDSRHQVYNTAPNPPRQAPSRESQHAAPITPQDEVLQQTLQALLQNTNGSQQQRQGYPTNIQSFGGGPFHMMSQHQRTHTETQTSSNQYVQQGYQVDNSNPFLQGIFPSSVQTTNTSNLDVYRLLLLSSHQQQQQLPVPSLQGNNPMLTNLLLQSLGTAVPPPVAPQMDPNLLNMFLGQIAINANAPSTASTHNFARPMSNVSAYHDKTEKQRAEKATDDSSADTCELAGVAPMPMSTQDDETHVSKYQCLVRKQIQFFEATEGDVASTAQGRNKPIVLGQVRCRRMRTMLSLTCFRF